MAGAIAMAGVFFVTIVEMVFTRGNMVHGGATEVVKVGGEGKGRKWGRRKGEKGKGRGVGEEEGEGEEMEAVRGTGTERTIPGESAIDSEGEDEDDSENASPSSSSARSEKIGGEGGVGTKGFGMVGRRRSRSQSFGRGMRQLEQENTRRNKASKVKPAGTLGVPKEDEKGEASEITTKDAESGEISTQTTPVMDPSLAAMMGGHTHFKSLDGTAGLNHTHTHAVILTEAQRIQKAKLQVILLEMGILFHSIFIGMALSVTVGPPFVVLFIAIIFHQTFEGLALGSRIALIDWGTKTRIPYYMASAYGLTTPVGQAIGLAVHTLYSPQSQTGLLVVGIMNAISSGLLLYAGLVELLAEDFLSDESWIELRGRKRVLGFSMVVLGAVGMGVVGAWA